MYTLVEPVIGKKYTSWTSVRVVITVMSLRISTSTYISDIITVEGIWRFAEFEYWQEKDEDHFNEARQEPV